MLDPTVGVIEISDHPFLTRHGQELHCEIPLTFSQCALGTTADAPTLDGAKPLQIPKGTQPGDTIRIRGLGMPDVRGRGVGGAGSGGDCRAGVDCRGLHGAPQRGEPA